MDANSRPSISTASESVSVEFIEAHIPGAALDVFFSPFALVTPVPRSQASTFVEKAKVDFKIGSFSITRI